MRWRSIVAVFILVALFTAPAEAFLYSTRRTCYTQPSTFDQHLNNEVNQCSNSTVGRAILFINDWWPDWLAW